MLYFHPKPKTETTALYQPKPKTVNPGKPTGEIHPGEGSKPEDIIQRAKKLPSKSLSTVAAVVPWRWSVFC